MGEMRNAYKILVIRPEGKRPFGRPRRRWEDNNQKIYGNDNTTRRHNPEDLELRCGLD
jgi:hypothetical protein